MLLDKGPSPTKDVDQAKFDLTKYGFCLVPDVLNPKEIKLAKERLLEQAEAEEELGLSFRDGGPKQEIKITDCLLYTSPSPRDGLLSRMPSSA